MRAYLAKKEGKKPSSFSNVVLTDAQKHEAKESLTRAEQEKLMADRKTIGDASETGLIKFC